MTHPTPTTPEARCPECGVAARNVTLDHADPAWRRRITSGQWTIMVGLGLLLLAPLGPVIMVFSAWTMPLHLSMIITIGLPLVGLLLMNVGVRRLTTPEPRRVRDERLERAVRRAQDGLAASLFAALVPALASVDPRSAIGLMLAWLFSGMAFAYGFHGLTVYLAHLVVRLPDVRLSRRIASLRGFPVYAFVIGLAALVPTIWWPPLLGLVAIAVIGVGCMITARFAAVARRFEAVTQAPNPEPEAEAAPAAENGEPGRPTQATASARH